MMYIVLLNLISISILKKGRSIEAIMKHNSNLFMVTFDIDILTQVSNRKYYNLWFCFLYVCMIKKYISL